MRDLLRLVTPPDLVTWSTLQRVVYWTVFLALMTLVSLAAHAITHVIFAPLH